MLLYYVIDYNTSISNLNINIITKTNVIKKAVIMRNDGCITDPTDRESFKKYIRSRLGEPIIELNVTDFQVDQAVDEALRYFRDYHYNGTNLAYWGHKLTDEDVKNRYIDLPDNIVGVVDVYDMQDQTGLGISANIYSGAWQMNFDMIFGNGGMTSSNNNFINYYINRMTYDMINDILEGKRNIRYNMNQQRLYLDNDWSNYTAGNNIVVECYQAINPDENKKMWADRWLIRYATAKLKRQWGENISKYDATLPGGNKLNYERIINEAQQELDSIEQDMLQDYSIPPRDLIG